MGGGDNKNMGDGTSMEGGDVQNMGDGNRWEEEIIRIKEMEIEKRRR